METDWRLIAGRVLVVLGGVVLLGSAAAKLAGVPAVVADLGALGFAGDKLTLIAVIEAVSGALFLLPRTRSAGFLLVSAFLGGAVATHVQHDLSIVRPASVLTMVWLGAWLRHPEILWSLSPAVRVGPAVAQRAR